MTGRLRVYEYHRNGEIVLIETDPPPPPHLVVVVEEGDGPEEWLSWRA